MRGKRLQVQCSAVNKCDCGKASMTSYEGKEITGSLQNFAINKYDCGNRGGQTFPKSTEFRNSVAFRPFFGSPFSCFSVGVAESVS